MVTATRTVKATNNNIPFRASLAAWYRYNKGITNQSGCSSWADMSGNSRPLLQATAANRPAIRSNGSLVFDGAASYMQATFTLVQPVTIYILFTQIAWTLNSIVFDGVTAAAQLIQSATTPALTLNAGSALTASTTIPVNRYGAAACVLNSTSSVYQAGSGGPSVTTTGDAGSNNLGGFTIGADRNGANFASIHVREIAIYSKAHDATTRLAVLRYMSRLGGANGGMA